MPDNVNADTPGHDLFMWGFPLVTKIDDKWLRKMQDQRDTGGFSINDLIRAIRKVKKMGYPFMGIDVTIDLQGVFFTQWNDGIAMTINNYAQLDKLLDDLMLLRKLFNAAP